ncbi:hypothetical protein B0H13DRAFT_2343934 [Mycena leptocephala]|nr:hypothetical protein B0H13DRAFT_2343934 [Mycena leptocephala]
MTPVAPPFSSPCANWSLLPFDLVPGLSWPTVVPLSNSILSRLFSKLPPRKHPQSARAPPPGGPRKAIRGTRLTRSRNPETRRSAIADPQHTARDHLAHIRIHVAAFRPFLRPCEPPERPVGPQRGVQPLADHRLVAAFLWTTIFLDFTDEDWDAPSFELIQPKLAAYLARSKQLPLNITFRAFWHEALCAKRELRVLELLALHCERWETISFAGPSMLYCHLDGIRGKLPVLRALDIRVRQEHCAPASGPLDIFESCPRLQEASVNAGRYDGDRPIAVKLPEGVVLR